MEKKDPYKALGISRDASQDDIRKARRKLVRKYHPNADLEDPPLTATVLQPSRYRAVRSG